MSALTPGELVRTQWAPGRSEWRFAQYCVPATAPVLPGEWGVVLGRTADRKLENYQVRLLGRAEDVVLGRDELTLSLPERASELPRDPALRAHLTRLGQGVTPGRWISPWERLDADRRSVAMAQIQNDAGDVVAGTVEHDSWPYFAVTEPDAALITQAPVLRALCLDLLTENERLREELEDLREHLSLEQSAALTTPLKENPA